MKKIIDGKVYDTEKAVLIGRWNTEGLSAGDFNYCKEELYKTKKGSYFISGRGGAMTRYSVSDGSNSWTGGSGITPLTIEEALEWAERKLDSDDVEREFSDMLQEA